MSNVPLTASTSPAARRWPSPASTAAPKVNSVPAIVTWLGVIGSRPSSRASLCALRLTHAWKRVVNTRLHLLSRLPGAPGLLIDLDHLGRDHAPGVALRLGKPGLPQAAPEQPVPGHDRQRRAQLDRALGPD